MNKNLDVKLKGFQVKRLKKWLELSKYVRSQTCPFANLEPLNSCRVCEKVLLDFSSSDGCPCSMYGLNSVTDIVEELVRRHKR